MIQSKDEEIAGLKKNMLVMSNLFAEDVVALRAKEADLKHDLDITEGELSIFQKSEKEWIGRSLKLRFILDEIKKIGALPKDHAEWVEPMVEDIEIPEVSINIRDEFVPTTQTDNIDWTDDEEEDDFWDEDEEDVIGDYLDNETTGEQQSSIHCTHCGEFGHTVDECSMATITRIFNSSADLDETSDEARDIIPDQHGSMMDVLVPQMEWPLLLLHPYPRDILEKSVRTIQGAWREYLNRRFSGAIDQVRADLRQRQSSVDTPLVSGFFGHWMEDDY